MEVLRTREAAGMTGRGDGLKRWDEPRIAEQPDHLQVAEAAGESQRPGEGRQRSNRVTDVPNALEVTALDQHEDPISDPPLFLVLVVCFLYVFVQGWNFRHHFPLAAGVQIITTTVSAGGKQ